MKTKKINNKLTLKKKNIANLNFSETKGVHGGEITVTLCDTCISGCICLSNPGACDSINIC